MPTLSIRKIKPNVEALVLAADLTGTIVFAIEGALSAMRGGLDLLGVMVISFVAALGGGVIRDLLMARVPLVLHADIYATAAFAGAFIVVVARRAGLPPGVAALAGGAVCFILRVLAVTYGWHLPKASLSALA
jgi:uncharacterized membrane protein YeiH